MTFFSIRLDLRPLLPQASDEQLAATMDFRLHETKPGVPKLLYTSPQVNELFKRLLGEKRSFAGALLEPFDIARLLGGLGKLEVSPQLSGAGAQKVFLLGRSLADGADSAGYLPLVGHGEIGSRSGTRSARKFCITARCDSFTTREWPR